MPREPLRHIHDPSDWDVVISAARTEIVEAFRLLGPCSIADVAAAIGRPADALYRHVEVLRDAGFVAEAGYRKSGRHVEQIFDVTAEDFVLDFPAEDSAARSARARSVLQTAQAFTKAVVRAIKDAGENEALIYESASRNFAINYELSRLTPEKFREVRALIGRLKVLMDEGKSSKEGDLYMTLAIATPVRRARKRRMSSGAASSTDVQAARPKADGSKPRSTKQRRPSRGST